MNIYLLYELVVELILRRSAAVFLGITAAVCERKVGEIQET